MNKKLDIECTISSRGRLKQYIADNTPLTLSHGEVVRPIFEILVFEHPDKEWVFPSGKPSGLPDMGTQSNVGFYYDLEDAFDAVSENLCDIRETVYDAAFIICRFPGLYDCVSSNGRLYFVWDGAKGGYKLAEEPEIFKHISL